ncbi:hypothetical protein [Hydrogenophaga palleronii]|uniref:hypothetical protein n=1 Tax=Hydrogenophaga palleronii TaxID=65655 RepID=UPI000826E0F7|nr:hypothetical protein [Hydrogenophaga palleronii]
MLRTLSCAALVLLASACATEPPASDSGHSYLVFAQPPFGRVAMEMQLPNGFDCQQIRQRTVADLVTDHGIPRARAESLVSCSPTRSGARLQASLVAKRSDTGALVESRFPSLAACLEMSGEFQKTYAAIVQPCAAR